jgi:hypothetical protein
MIMKDIVVTTTEGKSYWSWVENKS